ncbi:hypothetical protein A2U01_0054035, partial [Trifolium medium]|nr:hypothetical protein [Trifolium medium]
LPDDAVKFRTITIRAVCNKLVYHGIELPKGIKDFRDWDIEKDKSDNSGVCMGNGLDEHGESLCQ